jgi:hypothetical protein
VRLAGSEFEVDEPHVIEELEGGQVNHRGIP